MIKIQKYSKHVNIHLFSQIKTPRHMIIQTVKCTSHNFHKIHVNLFVLLSSDDMKTAITES